MAGQVKEIIHIGSKADTRGFKKVESASEKLGKSVKKLAVSMGVALSARTVANFGISAVKAFAEDQKAATRLAKVVDNLGLSFANPQISDFIDKLSLASGVADTELRPAFQSLLTTTGDLVGSQKMLQNAIDISVGSGIDLTTVANDLSQAYVGNVKGIKKYNIGLSQQQLKTKSFVQIQELLNKQFGGSNAEYLKTYAGQMQQLNTAAGEAKETIGGGLMQVLVAITGNDSISGLADDMKRFADNTSDGLYGLSLLIDKINTGIPSKAKGAWFGLLGKKASEQGWYQGAWAGLQKLGKAQKQLDDQLKAQQNYDPKNSFVTNYAKDRAAAAAAEKAARDRAAALLKAQQANTKEITKQTMLKKQSSLFDLSQIQIIAALKGQLSEEDAKRLRLQLAILTGNETEAAKLTKEIANSIDSTGKLAEYLAKLPDAKNPFVAWKGYLDDIEKQLIRINTGNPTNPGGTTGKPIPGVVGGSIAIPTTNAEAIATGNNVTGQNRFGAEIGGGQTIKIDLNVDGKLLAQVLQDASLSGNQVYVNRITGGFYQ